MTTQTTTTLLPTRRAALTDRLRQFDPWTIAALAVVIVASLAYAWQVRREQPAAPVATLAPVILIATARPEPTADTIAVAVAEMRLPRAVVAYDAPGGRVIGAVDSGRAYEIIARSGLDWMQLRIDGSGDIWIQRADLEGPDLATPEPPPPTAAPVVVYVAPATPDLPPPTAMPESPFGSKPNRRAAPPQR